MKTYEFMDRATGEMFFVQAENQPEAEATAATYFEEPFLYGRVSEEYAERMGYDIY